MLLAARGYDVVAEAASAATALESIRIVVVDDHPLFRHGLIQLLNSDDGFAVCGVLTRARPELAVLLASADEPKDPERITRCGARGFVRKTHLPRIDFGRFWPRG